MWSVCIPTTSDDGAGRRELVSWPYLDVDAASGAGGASQRALRPPSVDDAMSEWWWWCHGMVGRNFGANTPIGAEQSLAA